MRRLIFGLVVVVVWGVGQVEGDVVVDLNSEGDALGIRDLDVDGTLYNVDFVYGTFNDIFAAPSEPPCFGRTSWVPMRQGMR